MGNPAKGMGPRMVGKEEYERMNSAHEIAKALGFGARMLTDSPDELKPDGSRGPVGEPSASEQEKARLIESRGSEQEKENLQAAFDGATPGDTVTIPATGEKGYSTAEVKRLMEDAPARAQELFEAEQRRPDGMRPPALKAIRAAALKEENHALAEQAQEALNSIKKPE